MRKLLLLAGFIYALIPNLVLAQCATPITSFPYTEGFESGPANWFSGGINDDWAWGSPNKSLIQSAGGGSSCWVTGGLNGSFYSFGQRSWVQSPCFDFSLVSYPFVSFKIWWESENIYDGTTFQYSIDNGITWLNVGTDSDPVNCLNENWFNQNNITALTNLASPKHGWAGTMLPTSGSCNGGNGISSWVTAKHCMTNLSGQPQVIFRFAFGSGTICNAFDGFAFDDVYIGEAPPNQTDFSYNCTTNSLEYQFQAIGALCPDTYSWNFGDPASGVNNTSNIPNPVHQFSAPGSYTVSLNETGPCNAPGGAIKLVVTIGATTSITAVSCNNPNSGAINVSAQNASGLVNYVLQPGNQTNNTGIFNGLGSGNYTTTVTDAIGCSYSTVLNLANPGQLSFNTLNITPITCHNLQNGTIAASVSGGSGAITYSMSPGGQINSNGIFVALGAGIYTITAVDAGQCSISTVVNLSAPLPVQFSNFVLNNISCNGSGDGSASMQASGGTGVYTYTLNPGVTVNSSGNFNGLNAGVFTVVVTDGNNCSFNTSFSLSDPPAIVIDQVNIIQPECNPNNTGVINVTAQGGSGNLTYSIGAAFSSNNIFGNLTSDTYTVTVKDANGCTQSTIAILKSPNAPTINQISYDDIPCYGGVSGGIQIQASGIVSVVDYQVQPGNLNQASSLFPGQAVGSYTVTITDANLCTATSIFQVTQPQPIVFTETNFIPDSCGSNFIGTLRCQANGGTGNILYRVEPLNQNNSTGIFQLIESGVYKITATDVNGCQTNSTIEVKERICCDQVFVPNAFSPNGDGLNDELKVLNLSGVEFMDMMVYNKWGNQVFITQNAEFGWNGNYKGTQAETGTYFYLVRYKCRGTGQMYTLKGDCILLR